MFNLSFSIRNPWSKRWNCVKIWHGSITKNKHWELQIDKTSDIIAVDVRYSIRQDHAGFFVTLGLFGYEAILNIYDSRHWDYDTNTWVKYD